METADISRAKSILLLRYDRLGDMVISTGLFRLLKEDHPGLRIHVLASPANRAVVRHDPNVYRIHVFDKRRPLSFPGLMAGLRRERFDAVVNLVFYSSLTGAVISRLCAPASATRVRVTTGDGLDHFYNVNDRRRIWGDASRTMLEETALVLNLLGGSAEGRDASPSLFLAGEPLRNADVKIMKGDPAIGVNLAAGSPDREWSLDRWAGAVRLLLARFPGASVNVFTPPGDRRGMALCGMLRESRVIAVEHEQDILRVAETMSSLSVIITPDTALLHVADALGIPVVAMYISHEKSVLWKPFRSRAARLVAPDGKLDSIHPSELVKAVVEVLEDRH